MEKESTENTENRESRPREHRDHREGHDHHRGHREQREYTPRREKTPQDYFYNGTHVRDEEPVESALKRFKREVTNAGILTELKKREFYEKPSIIKKRAVEAAVRKRMRKKMMYND